MKYVRRRGVGEVLLVLEEVIDLSNHHGVGEASHGEVHRWPCDDEKIHVKMKNDVFVKRAWT